MIVNVNALTVSNVSASGDENNAIAITLNDDTDSDSITYSVVTNPSNGSVSISGAVATYTPNANFVGTNSFTYKANDGMVDSATNATVSITINEADFDNDGTNNDTDTDDDNDGVADSSDVFPLDSTESVDTDSDGIGNTADTDDDGDGYTDAEELAFGSSPLDASSKIRIDFSSSVDAQINSVSGLDSIESNLKLWLDSSNINATSNAGINDNDSIQKWLDLSGNA